MSANGVGIRARASSVVGAGCVFCIYGSALVLWRRRLLWSPHTVTNVCAAAAVTHARVSAGVWGRVSKLRRRRYDFSWWSRLSVCWFQPINLLHPQTLDDRRLLPFLQALCGSGFPALFSLEVVAREFGGCFKVLIIWVAHKGGFLTESPANEKKYEDLVSHTESLMLSLKSSWSQCCLEHMSYLKCRKRSLSHAHRKSTAKTLLPSMNTNM